MGQKIEKCYALFYGVLVKAKLMVAFSIFLVEPIPFRDKRRLGLSEDAMMRTKFRFKSKFKFSSDFISNLNID